MTAKLSEPVIYNQVSYYLKFKLNTCQHHFIKSKSTTTDLETYPVFITPLVSSHSEAHAVYFYLSNAFNPVSHTPLLHKFSASGLSGDYVNCFIVT
jgi:hypothetical protein